MNGGVVDVVAVLEQMLRPVPVMHVEVEDEHALDSGLLAQPLGDAGDGVEEAEAHRRARAPRDDRGDAPRRMRAGPDLEAERRKGGSVLAFQRSAAAVSDRPTAARAAAKVDGDMRVVHGVEVASPIAGGVLELALVVRRSALSG